MGDESKKDDAFYTREKEIKELEALIPEIKEKITDTIEMKEESVRRIAEVRTNGFWIRFFLWSRNIWRRSKFCQTNFLNIHQEESRTSNLRIAKESSIRNRGSKGKRPKLRLLNSNINILQKTPVIENLFMTLMTSILFIFCTCIVYFTQRKKHPQKKKKKKKKKKKS